MIDEYIKSGDICGLCTVRCLRPVKEYRIDFLRHLFNRFLDIRKCEIMKNLKIVYLSV